MKKSALISLIVAIVLIFAGGILLVLGLSFAGNGSGFNQKVAEKTYVVNEPFHSIAIDTDTCDVTFVNTGSQFRMGCTETEKVSYAVVVENGVLKISAVDVRQWYDFISIFPQEQEITLYLPETQYKALQIESDTGDVNIPEAFSFETAELLCATGDIHFTAAVSQLLAAVTATGDVTVFSCSPTIMRITTTTGDVVLDEITGSCEFALCTDTGEVEAQNINCEVMACETTTGDISFYRVIPLGYLGLCSDTGDIHLEDCDSAEVHIETDTGDVTGNFLSPKWFITETDTGDIRVPLSREGGECRITTDTGDIVFF